MYTEYLKQLGLDDKEIAVFLVVLERGKVLPATVATITNINRSTVYSVAKELARKGLITDRCYNRAKLSGDRIRISA
jgi:sugar-specific transcriptional regulator TrmB